MKEKIKNFTFCLLCFITIFFIFKNNNIITHVILNSINMFLNKVFVSLFPMFIINDILVNTNIPYYFSIIFNNIFKSVFKISGIGAYIFIMSLISGTPTGVYIIKNLVENNTINELEASHYLYFTYFSNPLFLTLILSNLFKTPLVIKIIGIHYLSNIIIAFLIRNYAPKVRNIKVLKNSYINIKKILIKSINKAMNTLLMILGVIVFFAVLAYLLGEIIPTNDLAKVLIKGFLEITNGLNYLSSIKISGKLKEIISIAIISFGGISIHTQTNAILEDTNINYQNFFKGRIMQVIISVILIILF